MQAGAVFSLAGLLLGISACATVPIGPKTGAAIRIKEVRVVAAQLPGSNFGARKIWDLMGPPEEPRLPPEEPRLPPEEPRILTDSDPVLPLPSPRQVAVRQGLPDDTSCRRAAVVAERQHRLPHGLLSAIAYTESSMIPTALRVDGRSIYPKTKTEAERIAGEALSRSSSVMAGCMQVNLRVHDPHGAAWALDPNTSSNWAAEYLWELFDRLGSWPSAISAYGGSRSSTAYLYRVMQNMQTAESGPSYVQLASYQPGEGAARADCRYLTDGGPSWPQAGQGGDAAPGCGGQSDPRLTDSRPAERQTQAATFARAALSGAAFGSGCWNLPEWLDGHAQACNSASSGRFRIAAVASREDATVRLAAPEPVTRAIPVRRRAVMIPAESDRPAARPHAIHAVSLKSTPLPGGGRQFGSHSPHLALAPNRSTTRRKPRMSRSPGTGPRTG